ncbi:MAG: hypothetical protein HKP12_01255 [Gammaproteobacteria bacterium]|nr:hypothetical protein [Gammaproteobacteria bacterium]
MACPGTRKKKCDFSFSSFSITFLIENGGTFMCRTETLNQSFLKEFGVIGIADYSEDLTAELSVTSKTAGAPRFIRGA